MKLTSARIQNYRSIIDSGWVDVDDIAVIVGKNESGKTSFLKALWKFHPYGDEKYKIDREWPTGRRKEKSADKIVAETKFSFNAEEIAAIDAIGESAKGITGVDISRSYAGDYSHRFVPTNPSTEQKVVWVVELLQHKLPEIGATFSDHFKAAYNAQVAEIVADVRENGGSEKALTRLEVLKGQLPGFRHPSNPHHNADNNLIGGLTAHIDNLKTEITSTPLMRAVDLVHTWLPTFVYMDDHRTFVGAAQLDEVQRRSKENRLTPEDETIKVIMEMSGLSLDEEVRKGNSPDREQRMLDMNDASKTLTNLIADRWSQKKYEVEFRADGQHFNTFVKDNSSKGLVALEERSKGFQWFFSFDMRFMYETNGQFKNAIILLDEPGLHLHAAAQRDLMDRLKQYAKGNQLIYSTHLPFMIDFKRLDNIYVAEENEKEGSKVHKNWATADKDARFTLQAALGLSWSQSLFIGQFNLVVEGVDDFWFLTTFSSLFEDAGQPGLDPRLVVTPAGGASKVAYVGTILRGQELNVAVLLDSDPAGQEAFEQLVHTWIIKDNLVVMVGDAIGVKPCALEDLFGEAYYVAKTQEAYSKELGEKALSLNSSTAGKKSIVERIQDAFTKAGAGEFRKGRVSKRIMLELGKKDLKAIDSDTASKFRKLIDAINAVAATWK